MRRNDKEITEQKLLDEIMKKAQVCHLAVCYENMPYIVPMNFGYENQTLYFHSGPAGLKLSILQANPQACFEVEIDTQVVPGEQECDWTMRFQSVIGFGEAKFIEDLEEKREAMKIIMRQYSDKEASFKDEALLGLNLFKLIVNTMTGKKSGY